ncbi:MAG: ATP-binding protein [Chloroflexi bacterium]|nr:ATP-binding protein [Chloroflexota bacterium]
MIAYHMTSSGQTQVAILAGEAGIGKTRLAAEFLHWATAQGADMLSGRAFETGGELPYQPPDPTPTPTSGSGKSSL